MLGQIKNYEALKYAHRNRMGVGSFQLKPH